MGKVFLQNYGFWPGDTFNTVSFVVVLIHYCLNISAVAMLIKDKYEADQTEDGKRQLDSFLLSVYLIVQFTR